MDKSSNGIAQTEMAFTVPAACFTVEGLLIQRTYLVAVRLTISKSSYDLLLPVHVPVRIVLQNKKKSALLQPLYSSCHLARRELPGRDTSHAPAPRRTALHAGPSSTKAGADLPIYPGYCREFFFFLSF
jgi:hypothetical protein